tara:strand:+ start:276 stop:809 length:534 start_codon:yes stop_codon:yes gene_type:complete
MSKLINLFGGPGIGKSSIAAGLFYKLKKKHVSCNNPYEFPKVLAWDKNNEAIKDQLYVVANQHRGIAQSYGKVDYIIVDSPILFSTVYHGYYTKDYPVEFYGDTFHKLVVDLHKKYDNINILLDRAESDYQSEERFQDIDQSLELDRLIKESLIKYDEPFHTVKVGKNTVKEILKML